ncbi:NUDIX domain-containing protein [Candidatus Saccharibacteria bacterium]|nr:NUDIX domain-containing protein [Candidatus Saccharibacteria bacterium]
MGRESVAKILVFNDNNQVLILTTGIHVARPEKSHTPDLPGGLVDANESERNAVVRETREEVGITLDPNAVRLGYAETRFYSESNTSVTKLLYTTKLAATPEVTLSHEHEAYEWSDIDTLHNNHELRAFYQDGIAYIINNHLV